MDIETNGSTSEDKEITGSSSEDVIATGSSSKGNVISYSNSGDAGSSGSAAANKTTAKLRHVITQSNNDINFFIMQHSFDHYRYIREYNKINALSSLPK